MTRYRTANLAFQLRGDVQLLKWLARDADVLGLVECRDRNDKPVDVAKVLGKGWDVRQDLSSGKRAGSVIAARKSADVEIKRSHLQRISRASRQGAGVQDRYRRVAHLDDNGTPTRFAVEHHPLKSTGRKDEAVGNARRWVRRLRGAATRRRVQGFKRLRWMLVGDFNARHDAIRRELGAPFSAGVDVMGAVWSHGFGDAKVSIARHVPSTDHGVLTIKTEE